jgi:CheY-like chemotaxis protein
MMRMMYENKRQARILVVDDDRSIALTLTEILAEQGYEVATVFSGKEAVAKAAEFLPDLLLSDVNMEAMNGVESATRITAKLPDCRVLFLSGHVSMDDMLIASPKRLAFSLMSKPPRLLDLLNAIVYMLPAVRPEQNSESIVIDRGVFASHVNAKEPIETGFMCREIGFQIGASATAQSMPDAAFYDMTVQKTTVHELQMQ